MKKFTRIPCAAAVLLIAALLAVCLCSCGRQPETAVIELVGNPSTGYVWVYDMSEEGIVNEVSSEFVPGASGLDGAPGKYEITFEGVKAGEVTLSFCYLRTFEANSALRMADYVLSVDDKLNVSIVSTSASDVSSLITDSDSIVGIWTCTFDCTDSFDEGFSDVLEAEGVKDFDKRVTLPLTITFSDDNVCTYYFDSSSADASLREYLDALAKPLASYMYKNLEKNNGMTKDQVDNLFMQNYNMTLSDYCADLYNQITSSTGGTGSIFGESPLTNGYYRTEDNRLYLANTAEEVTEDSYFLYSIENGTLVLDESSGSFSGAFAGLEQYTELPLTLTRSE